MMSAYNYREEPNNPERKKPSKEFKQKMQEKYPHDPELRKIIEDLCYLTYDELNVLYKMWEEKWIDNRLIFIEVYEGLFRSTLPETCSYQGRFSSTQLAEEIWKIKEQKRRTAEDTKLRLYGQKEEIEKQLAYLSKELNTLQNLINKI